MTQRVLNSFLNALHLQGEAESAMELLANFALSH